MLKNDFKYDKSGHPRKRDKSYVKITTYNPAEADKINRQNAVKQLKKYIEEGKSLDEAAEILAKDEEILRQFEYLTKNGLDLVTIFKGWYKPHMNKDSKTCNLEVGEK